MRGTQSGIFSGKNRFGSAGLGLLIVIILVLAVLFGQWYLKRTVKDPDLAEGLMPWEEWRLREKSTKPVPECSEEQAELSEALGYHVNIELSGSSESRGEIRLTIHPSGKVIGLWSGNYYNRDKVNFDVQGGSFAGRVYPGKIYRDENGEDASKLYFLAKGKFAIHETDFSKDRFHIRVGDIYVRGWLDTDHRITSEIMITSDEDYFESFSWEAKPTSRIGDLFGQSASCVQNLKV